MEKKKKKSATTQINADSHSDKRGYKISENQRNNLRESAISWQAPEYEYHQKDISWYWLSLIIAIVLLALSIWQKNFLFAVFIAIAWIVIVYSAKHLPPVWEFKIDEKGIGISLPDNKGSQKFYPYSEIEGFDIHSESGEYEELIIKSKSRFSPYLKINILESDEQKIKNFLLKYLPQEEYRSSLADSVSKLIRF